MKRLILVLAAAALFTACEKNTYPDPGRATFYTFSSHQLNLIVDGVQMGTIEHAPAFDVPECGDHKYQVLILSAGEHRIHATENNDTLWVSDKRIIIPENGCVTVQLP